MLKFFKKYHKWLGIILGLIILSFVFSGIILNHREFLSGVSVSRKLLPREYRYVNWNNAAVKATVKDSRDSILIYGNVGIWLTDSVFSSFTDFNAGIPAGTDNHKINQILKTTGNELVAAAFSGLYRYDRGLKKWQSVPLPVSERNVVSMTQKGDTVYIITRSLLLKSADLKNFVVKQLPPPEGYDNKTGLFKTLWVIHSGEIYGKAGKLLIDFAGLVLAFLTITGYIVFINKIVLKKPAATAERKSQLRRSNRWNIKWHNKIGWITLLLLILNTTTGMFLRPPLLIAIAYARVGKIPHTELATPNPWFDNLRRIYYDSENDRFILSAMDGFYYSDDDFQSDIKMFPYQPPVSVMGVTVFEPSGNAYLVGSFEGLFRWNPSTGEVSDHINGKPYIVAEHTGRPIGDYLVSGFTSDYQQGEYIFEYGKGALSISGGKDFPSMPKAVSDDRMSLWNTALEFHTGRIYQWLIGDFYVLVVPLTGLILLFILISGFIVWLSPRYRKVKAD